MSDAKYVAFGPWFTINTCPGCKEPVSRVDIYDNRCCSHCGESGAVMLNYDVTTLRRAYTKKTWVPFMSEWVFQIKSREARFGYGGSSTEYYKSAYTRSSSSLVLAAACVAIM